MNAFKQNLEKRETIKGTGLFAKVDFSAGEAILEYQGAVLSREQLPSPLKPENDHYLQIGKDTFLGPSGQESDYVNHSCQPNAGFYIAGHRAILRAISLIKAGMEITFDYASTSTDTKEDWSLANCKCGVYACRKEISGFQYLDQTTQARYIELGIVPAYVLGNGEYNV